MKKAFLIFGLLVTFFAVSAQDAFAQEEKQTPAQIEIQSDPLLEVDAKANLEAAQTYFRTRKAYRAVLMRFEETFAAYPNYSKMDEFLYMAGMSSFYLSQNKGKQKLTAASTDGEKERFAPERLREEATMYLTMLVQKYPNSKFKSDAAKTLKELEKK